MDQKCREILEKELLERGESRSDWVILDWNMGRMYLMELGRIWSSSAARGSGASSCGGHGSTTW